MASYEELMTAHHASHVEAIIAAAGRHAGARGAPAAASSPLMREGAGAALQCTNIYLFVCAFRLFIWSFFVSHPQDVTFDQRRFVILVF